jgi:uncharacterized protein
MTQGPLEIGLRLPLLVREERLTSRPDACRVLYISDIHLRPSRSRHLAQQVLDTAKRAAPHVILLGGDLVDRASEADQLRSLVEQLCRIGPVCSIGGNHDLAVGIEIVRSAVEQGGGRWVHHDSVRFHVRGREIGVAGPESKEICEGHVRILCAHNPRVWKAARNGLFDLVLAGHLHGCQSVAFRYRDRLYPGAWFYPYNYLNNEYDGARLIVSRGASDRSNRASREVIACSRVGASGTSGGSPSHRYTTCDRSSQP